MNNINLKNNVFFKKAKKINTFIINVVKATSNYLSNKVRAYTNNKPKNKQKNFQLLTIKIKKKFFSCLQKIKSLDLKNLNIKNIKQKLKNIPPLYIAFTAVPLVMLLFFCLIGSYCSTHFLTGATVNGVDVSGMSLAQAKQAISSSAQSYCLTLYEKDGLKETIKGSDIGLTVLVTDEFNNILKKESGYCWLSAMFGNKEITTDEAVAYYYDGSAFDKKISSLQCVSPAFVTEPINAELIYEKGTFSITPSSTGNVANKNRLANRVKLALKNQESKIYLENESVYSMPAIFSDDAELLAKQHAFNQIAGINITLKFGENTEEIDSSEIIDWYNFSFDGSDYTFEQNQDAIYSYAAALAEKYNTIHSPKMFVTHSGETIEIGNSYYGWQLDNDYAADMLKNYVNNHQSVSLDLTDRSEESDKWWLKVGVAYDDFGYYGNTYAEVSINGQYMWMYTDGVVSLESDVVTGKPDSEHDTPVGIYSLIYKEQNATLRGEDYETKVAYWMVFTTDIGFHDADWQYAFGEDMYETNGSHGCVNLPIEVAEQLYDLVYPGMPVFVY